MSDAGTGPDFHPLYLQVKELLIQRVLTGDWKPGEALPSEIKLAQEYHVSQGTVRKALEEMAQEHLVSRQQGRGTFVNARQSEAAVNFFSIVTADNHRITRRANTPIATELAAPTDEEQNIFNIGPDDMVCRIQRLRGLNGKTALSEEIVIVDKRLPGFSDLLARADASTYTYLIMEREFGVMVVRAEDQLRAVAADGRTAQWLGIAEGAPLLEIRRISYALDGYAVEYRTMLLRTEDFMYFNVVS